MGRGKVPGSHFKKVKNQMTYEEHKKESDQKRKEKDHLAECALPGVIAFYGDKISNQQIVKKAYEIAESMIKHKNPYT